MQLRGAAPNHHPLPVEGRSQPTRLRSVARTARKPPRPARKAPRTAMPAAPAVYASTALGMACWEFDVRRAGRFLAAARTPLRQVGSGPATARSRLWRHRGLPDPRRPRPPTPGSRSARRVAAAVRTGAAALTPRVGRPLIAPARPSPAPRGGARVSAPLPGLRQRAPTRYRSRQIRQQPLCASPSPRPRRTTWRGTPSPA